MLSLCCMLSCILLSCKSQTATISWWIISPTCTFNEDHPSLPALLMTTTLQYKRTCRMFARYVSPFSRKGFCWEPHQSLHWKKMEKRLLMLKVMTDFGRRDLMARWELSLQLANSISDPEMKGRWWEVGDGTNIKRDQMQADVFYFLVSRFFVLLHWPPFALAYS